MSGCPPPRDLARLYALTGRLANPFLSAAEDATLARQLAALPARDWPRLAQLADRSHLLPALWPRLQALDLTAAPPHDIVEACHAAHLLNADRNRRLVAEAQRIAALLAPTGLRPVFLKGVAQIMDGTYAQIGTRLTTDIDLLLPPERVGEAATLLQDAGYSAKESQIPALDISPLAFHLNHHIAGLRHPDSPATTEVHHRFFPTHRQVLTSEDILSKAHPSRNQPTLLVPCATHRALMALGHTPLRFRVIWGDQIRFWDAIDMQAACQSAGIAPCDLMARFQAAGCGRQAGWMLRWAQDFAGVTSCHSAALPLPGAARYHLERGLFLRPALRHALSGLPFLPPLVRLATGQGYSLHLRNLLTDKSYRSRWRTARRADKKAHGDP